MIISSTTKTLEFSDPGGQIVRRLVAVRCSAMQAACSKVGSWRSHYGRGQNVAWRQSVADLGHEDIPKGATRSS